MYSLLKPAFSQPNQLLAKLAYPYVSQRQKRFAVDSQRIMVRMVNQQADKETR